MRTRSIVQLLVILLCGALGVSAQGIVGLNPTPVGLYQWNSTTNQAQPITNAYGSFALSSPPQPMIFYGWNASLGQWVPCTIAQPCQSAFGSVTQIVAGTNITISPSGGTGAVTINAATGAGSPLTTKGDLYTFGATNARLPVGLDGQVLTAASAQALGLQWQFPAFQSLSTAGTSGPATLTSGVLNVPIYANAPVGLASPPNVSTALAGAAYYGAVSSSNVAWMGESGNDLIAQVTTTGAVSTVAVAGATFGENSQGAFDGSGNFWTNSGTTVYEISPAGAVVTSFPVAAGTYGSTLDHAGNIWVSYRQPSSDVAVYSPSGALLHTISVGYADHLFTDAGGVIWATDYLTGNVYRISASTYVVLSTVNVGLGGTLYLSFDSGGNAWVTGAFAQISEVAASGSGVLVTYNLPSEFAGGITGERFWGIAVDGNNNIWVTGTASPGQNVAVAVMSTSGYTLGVFFLAPQTSGQNGTGILYSNGHVWVGNSTNTVTVFNDALNGGIPAYAGGTFNAAGDIDIPAQSLATSSNNFNSYSLKWTASFFNVTPQMDKWAANVVLGTGTAPSSTLTFTHPEGTTGTLGVAIPPIAPASGTVCMQIDPAGNITNTGFPCGTPLIANTTIATTTTAVPANSCLPTTTTYNTVAMTGLATTSVVEGPTPQSDVNGVTGFSQAGATLYFVMKPTANTLNWQLCNNTAASITPSAAVTWNVGAR